MLQLVHPHSWCVLERFAGGDDAAALPLVASFPALGLVARQEITSSGQSSRTLREVAAWLLGLATRTLQVLTTHKTEPANEDMSQPKWEEVSPYHRQMP